MTQQQGIVKRNALQKIGSAVLIIAAILNDQEIDNVATGKVVDLWRAHGAADIKTYQFPADLHLDHGLFDVQDPDPNVIAMVYSKLLKLIDW